MESMLKVLFYINIFAILMSCHSCRREKANVEIQKVVDKGIIKSLERRLMLILLMCLKNGFI